MDEEDIRVFMVDDDEDDYVLTRDLLAEAVGARFELDWVDTYEAALEAMERAEHKVYLVDYRLGERDGVELLHAAIARGCKAPIIMLTGHGDRAVDVAAMKAGAADYLDKSGLSAPLLERSIRYAIERQRAEEKLEHLNLVLRAIRSVNQLIVREKDRARLLQGACDHLIKTRGYHNAWSALFDESGELVATAEAGLGEGFTPLGEQLKRGELTACGRRALTQSEVVVTEDPLSTCADCPLAANYGGRGALTVRLEHGGKVYGLLSASIPAHLAADREEQALFGEVARDIAFALHSIELEEARQRAEEALRERVKELACLYEVNHDMQEQLSIDELCKRVVEHLVRGMRFPEIAVPVIELDGRQFTSERYAEGLSHRLHAEIRVGGEARGHLWVYYAEDRPFLIPEEQSLINAVVEDLGLWLERKGAETELAELKDRLAMELVDMRQLHELSTRLLKETEIAPLLHQVLEASIELLGADKGNIQIYDEQEKALKIVTSVGFNQDFLDYFKSVPVGFSATCGAALERRERVIVEDVFADPVFADLRSVFASHGLVAVQSTPLFSHDGELYGMLSTHWRKPHRPSERELWLLDLYAQQAARVIERQRAEEALRESQRFIQEIADATPDMMIYLYDLVEQRTVYVNRQIGEILGYTKEDIQEMGSRMIEILVHPDDLESVTEHMKKVATDKKGEIIENEYRMKHAGGEWRWLLSRDIVFTRNADGLPTRNIGVAMDITERKRAEEALAEERNLLRTVIDNLPDCIHAKDTESRFVIGNIAVARVMGAATPDELLGKRDFDFYPQELAEQYCAGEEEIIRSGKPLINREEPLVDQTTGRKGWFSTTKVPLRDSRGEIVGIVGIGRDITARKRAEEALRQSHAKLQRALEGTVHTLVATIELKDPYTAGHQRRVTQLACAIAKEMGLPQEQSEGLRMAGLIHDLGKITVPAEILSKPSRLSDLEYGLIRGHPQTGYGVLKDMDFPWPVADIVLQHHERLDGSGYPQGLLREEIMLEARILAVADVVEAMASHRPYRSAPGLDKALEEISQHSGVLYDAEVVDVCLTLFTEKRFTFE
jgi:PAS domain S-box-containing protein